MNAPIDYKKFQAKLNAYNSGQPYTVEEAAEAFHIAAATYLKNAACSWKNGPAIASRRR